MDYDPQVRLPDGVTVPFEGQPGKVDDSGWRCYRSSYERRADAIDEMRQTVRAGYGVRLHTKAQAMAMLEDESRQDLSERTMAALGTPITRETQMPGAGPSDGCAGPPHADLLDADEGPAIVVADDEVVDVDDTEDE